MALFPICWVARLSLDFGDRNPLIRLMTVRDLHFIHDFLHTLNVEVMPPFFWLAREYLGLPVHLIAWYPSGFYLHCALVLFYGKTPAQTRSPISSNTD